MQPVWLKSEGVSAGVLTGTGGTHLVGSDPLRPIGVEVDALECCRLAEAVKAVDDDVACSERCHGNRRVVGIFNFECEGLCDRIDDDRFDRRQRRGRIGN